MSRFQPQKKNKSVQWLDQLPRTDILESARKKGSEVALSPARKRNLREKRSGKKK